APWLARPATWRLLDLMVAAMMLGMAVQLVLRS
ncbi:amino acid transporter, partial [Pseudomonas aeruginosa]|nr:amino acid transporter [Pseudomonas aeruginosa]